MTINLNTTPYHDDFDNDKGFLKILFTPGYSVQARELTQIQSILQKQISNLSDSFYKNGAMVVPGGTSMDIGITYIKVIRSVGSSYNAVSDFVGRDIINTIGILATVVHVESSILDDDNMPIDVFFRESLSTNYLIEEFMLLANKTVAKYIGFQKKRLIQELILYTSLNQKCMVRMK